MIRAGALFAFLLAMALPAPAGAGHAAGPPAGAEGLLPPPEPLAAPSISGIARAGATLTARDGTWEGDPGLTRQWLRCDSAGGACIYLHDTDSNYTLAAADVGKRIRLRVRATMVGGSREVDSAPTGVVAAQAPAAPAGTRPSVLVPPTVEGVLREGEIILASPGIWLGSEPMRFTNRWDRCDARRCVSTGEQTFLNRLDKEDVGKRMRARVTASNAAGGTAMFTPQSAIVKPRIRRYERLEPFPVIGISGLITPRGVRLRRLAVRAPRGSGLRVSCRGEGCPYRSARTRMRRSLFLVRRLLNRRLVEGTVIELHVTGRDRIGKYTRFRILRDRKPARVDRCLVPGQSRPSRCPRAE